MQICASGSVSGARCYGTVAGSGHFRPPCWPWAGEGCASDVYEWWADGNNGISLIQPGDSGGPIFVPHGNTVTAVGTVSIGNSNGSRAYFPDVYTEAVLNHSLDLTR
jgi:hypothetical protein